LVERKESGVADRTLSKSVADAEFEAGMPGVGRYGNKVCVRWVCKSVRTGKVYVAGPWVGNSERGRASVEREIEVINSARRAAGL